jgi:hypothetical protein
MEDFMADVVVGSVARPEQGGYGVRVQNNDEKKGFDVVAYVSHDQGRWPAIRQLLPGVAPFEAISAIALGIGKALEEHLQGVAIERTPGGLTGETLYKFFIPYHFKGETMTRDALESRIVGIMAAGENMAIQNYQRDFGPRFG